MVKIVSKRVAEGSILKEKAEGIFVEGETEGYWSCDSSGINEGKVTQTESLGKDIRSPWEKKDDRILRRMYYWQQKAADVTKKIRNCEYCAKNTVRIWKITNKLKQFPSYEIFYRVGIDTLGPIKKSYKCRRFLSVINDRFSKVTLAVPLRIIYEI